MGRTALTVDESKLTPQQMKRARIHAFYGELDETEWNTANDVQRVVLHHIKLLRESIHEVYEDN